MLTYRTGAAGAPSAARAMADHLLEQTLPQAQAELAEYYQRGLAPAEPDATVAEPRRDMDPRVARLLGLDPNRAPSVEAIAQLLAGNRADGARIPGKQVQRAGESLAALLGLEPSTLPSPAASRSLMAFSVALATVGRPSRTPLARALSSPAFTRLRIISRSNSANAPVTWKNMRPAGVVVSMAC